MNNIRPITAVRSHGAGCSAQIVARRSRVCALFPRSVRPLVDSDSSAAAVPSLARLLE
jgi:hypothetical protein